MFYNLLYQISIGGINHTLAGNGGEDCINFIPNWQRILETIFFVILSCYGVKISIKSLNHLVETKKSKMKTNNQITKILNCNFLNCCSNTLKSYIYNNSSNIVWVCAELRCLSTQKIVFKLYFIVFVIELLYKILTRTAIFLLNPCHLSTILQLILLKMPESNCLAIKLFRFHLYTVPGALIAILFPILNTRLMFGEVLIYYIQHALILVIPLYLMFIRESFFPEEFRKTSWAVFSISIIILYHFIFLQILGYFTRVNLNCILCPAVSDPFSGRFWRVIAVFHQSLAIPIITKLYGFFSLNCINFLNSLIIYNKNG